MHTAKRISRNTTYLGIAEVISRALQFVIMLYAARLLTQSDFGKFNFALSLSLIAVVLADLGINTFLIREIARKKEQASKYFTNALVLKAVLSIATFGAIVAIVNVLSYPPETKSIVYIIWLFTIVSTFTELFYSIFRAFEQMQYDAIIKITRMVLLATSTLTILFTTNNVLFFCYMFVLVEIIIVAIAACIAFKKFISLKNISVSFSKRILEKSLPFGFSIIFGSIYFFIGTVILSKMKGDVEVAIFSAAYNIALALLFIPTVYTNAIYPVLSKYFKSSKKSLRTIYERSFKYLYIIGLPISVGLYLIASQLIEFLYKNQYQQSTIVLQIISMYLFLKFINFLLGITLASIDQQKKRMTGQGITATLNIILHFTLIPILGFVGAAFATLLTEIALFLIYYLFVSRSWYYFNFLKILIKPAVAIIVMSLFVLYVPLHFLVQIPIAAGIYFLLLIIFKTFDKKDVEILKSIIR